MLRPKLVRFLLSLMYQEVANVLNLLKGGIRFRGSCPLENCEDTVEESQQILHTGADL